MSDGISCSFEDCPNDSARSGLCWGHLKQRERGETALAPLAEYATTPWDAVRKSALAYADADSEKSDDGAAARAEDVLKKAILRYMQSLPYFRALLQWVGRMERFRRQALGLPRAAPPPLPSLNSLKWVGPETLKELKDAKEKP